MELRSEDLDDAIAFVKDYMGDDLFVCETTSILDDLELCGDDAEEFLAEFGRECRKDVSAVVFSRYFPDEGSADMNFLLAKFVWQDRKRSAPLRIVNLVEAAFWRMFARRVKFDRLTLGDLSRLPPC